MAILEGDSGINLLIGMPEADEISGFGGIDLLRGAGGDDTIDGGDGPDSLYGDQGNDVILGGRGDDVIRGGKGNDTLDGGEGRDSIRGDIGNDWIMASEGGDFIDGGPGWDTVDYSMSPEGIAIEYNRIYPPVAGSEFRDTTTLMTNSGSAHGLAEGDAFDGIEVFIGSEHADLFTSINHSDNVRLEFYGGEGDDELFGWHRNIYLDGGEGNDQLTATNSDGLSLTGGPGSDTFVFFWRAPRCNDTRFQSRRR